MSEPTAKKELHEIVLPAEVISDMDEIISAEGFTDRSDFILYTIRKEISLRKWIMAVRMEKEIKSMSKELSTE